MTLDEKIRAAFETYAESVSLKPWNVDPGVYEDAFEDFKAGYRAALPRWIPVSESPKKVGDYLTINGAGFVQEERFNGAWSTDVQWWMEPLPQPPEREEG